MLSFKLRPLDQRIATSLLKAKNQRIKQLEQEVAQYQAYLREIMEIAYQAINKPKKEESHENNLRANQSPFSFLTEQPKQPADNGCGLA
jgi:sulfur transfer protein SufE